MQSRKPCYAFLLCAETVSVLPITPLLKSRAGRFVLRAGVEAVPHRDGTDAESEREQDIQHRSHNGPERKRSGVWRLNADMAKLAAVQTVVSNVAQGGPSTTRYA